MKCDRRSKTQIRKRMRKVLENPLVGKPMRYGRKGTREVYVGSYRLSYLVLDGGLRIIFADIYHKDEQRKDS